MPWYSEGTVQVAANGTIVTGTGTQFLTNIRIGDGLVIQGSTALHEVIGIASENQLTIRPAYAGTAGSGKQYAAAPLLGYDKDLSDAFNQLRLQFGGQLSALQPWAYAATASAARDALELGGAATKGVTASRFDTSGDRLLKYGDFGVGFGVPVEEATANNTLDELVHPGFYSGVGAVGGKPPGLGSQTTFPVIHMAVRSDSRYASQIVFSRQESRAWIRSKNGTWGPYVELQTTGNLIVGTAIGNVLASGSFGGFDLNLPALRPTDCNLATSFGFWWVGGGSANRPSDAGSSSGWLHVFPWDAAVGSTAQYFIGYQNKGLWFRTRIGESWNSWTRILTSGNTTVDSNGFLKAASPIIQLYANRITPNSQRDHAEFTRIDTGHYQLTGTNGLRLDDGWYIETPLDRNKVPYFNVDWEQDVEPDTEAGILDEPANVTLTIRCYERVWNPQTGQYDNGDPVDIPDGRWIDLRLNEVREPEPEDIDEPETEQPHQPSEPAGPIIPDVVTMAQAKLALHYAGLLQPVEDAINALPEAERTTALIEWHHRQTLERSHPLVAQVAAALELTEQRLDELFMDAAGR